MPPSIDCSIVDAVVNHTGLDATTAIEGGDWDSIAVAREAAPFFASGCLACLEAFVAAQVGRRLDDVDGGRGSSMSEVRASRSLPSDGMAHPFILPLSSVTSSFALSVDFGFFDLRDMPSSPRIFFLFPVVVAVGQGCGEERGAGGDARVGKCTDDRCKAGDKVRERCGDGTGVGTSDTD